MPDPDRIDALEMRLAHQERAIDDLNAALMRQWDRIDGLLREVAALRERVREAEEGAAEGGAPEPPPPHY